MLTQQDIQFFKNNGYLIVENLLTTKEVNYFRNIYEDFLSGKISTEGHRSDLSGLVNKQGEEKITQIMRPSLLLPLIQNSVLHQRTMQLVQELLGADMALDFDMMIDKTPNTNTPTPWHQDEAYWIDMADKRAATCWVALDDVVKENGCMWFVPKSHLAPLRTHEQTGKGGALQCKAEESEAVAAQIKAGSCTIHGGKTIHYARGNNTNTRRRAFICNFRPSAMIAYEREQGFDHLGERDVRQ